MRSWLTLFALTLAVGGLGAWLFHKKPRTEQETYALSSLKAAEVKRVVLGGKSRDGAAAEIVLEKRDSQWRVSAPFAARADASPVERLLSILDARATVRYAATDLARYGLDAPAATLTADGERIAYGSINPATREQYVLAANHVFVVPLNYAAALPRSIDALLDKSLFAADEKQPVRFDLPDFTVALEEGTWAVAPIENQADPDERNAWIDAWKHATALTVSRHHGPPPAETVNVTMKDGRVVVLGIAQREPDVVLVRADEGVAFHFFGEAGRKLLLPPAPSERINK